MSKDLANEIKNRINYVDLEYMEALLNCPMSSDEISKKISQHRNTVAKILNGLYKSCIIRLDHSSIGTNKKVYELTEFGKSVLSLKNGVK